MQKIIRLCYRKVIDADHSGAWERLVFEDSYREFLMQAQTFNQGKKHTTLSQILQEEKGADKLHFLVGAAVVGYVRQLNNIVPDINNALGLTFLPFSNFRFEVINSDITDRGRHQVAVNFYTEPLHWLDTVADRLLLALPDKREGDSLLTEMVALRPFLSIYSLTQNQAP